MTGPMRGIGSSVKCTAYIDYIDHYYNVIVSFWFKGS